MPSPRAYAAIIIAWGTLQFIADMGQERAAKAVAWLIVLAGMVLGPFGTTLTNLFTSVATSVAPTGASTATTPYPTPIPPQG